VCVYICVCVYMCVCVYIHICIYVCLYLCLCFGLKLRACSTHLYVHMCVSVCRRSNDVYMAPPLCIYLRDAIFLYIFVHKTWHYHQGLQCSGAFMCMIFSTCNLALLCGLSRAGVILLLMTSISSIFMYVLQ